MSSCYQKHVVTWGYVELHLLPFGSTEGKFFHSDACPRKVLGHKLSATHHIIGRGAVG